MAKRTTLQMVNLILKRLKHSEVADVSALTAGSHADMILEFINDAQNILLPEAEWYSLLTSEDLATVADTETVSVASDFDHTAWIRDTTNNRFLEEFSGRFLDEADPDRSNTGNPLYFTEEGTVLRFYPTPAGAYTLKHHYWKVPATLATNAATSDLPLFCEPLIIAWAEAEMAQYLEQREKHLILVGKFNKLLESAKIHNETVIDRVIMVDSEDRRTKLSKSPRYSRPIM